MWAETGLIDERLYVDGGSGTESSGECDDEDGCEGSGEDEQEIGAFFSLMDANIFLFIFAVAIPIPKFNPS